MGIGNPMKKLLVSLIFLAIALTLVATIWFFRVGTDFFSSAEESLPIVLNCPTDGDAPAIWIYKHPGIDDFETFLEFAIWSDGSFVFREDEKLPKSQLFLNKVDPTRLLQLVAKLEAEGLFSEEIENFHVPSSSGYVSLEIVTKHGEVFLASWHEEFEKDGQQELETEWSEGHRLLRTNWSIIREFCQQLKKGAAMSKRVSLQGVRASKY